MSEFRRDPVSHDWIIIAPERAKRPEQLLPKREPRHPTPKKTCPFEDLQKTGNWPPFFTIPDGSKWRVAVIPNKYPALRHSPVCAAPMQTGPYVHADGIGYHDLVVSRDHTKTIADLSLERGLEIFEALQRRYRAMAEDPCLYYTTAFFNWGTSAGASLFHPHYQVLSLPIVPPEVVDSLSGSARYFKKHHRCVHCDILKHERKVKKRIIEENDGAIALAPFVPKSRFEVSIYPKRHQQFFERTPRADIRAVVGVLGGVMRRMRKYLNDPDLNFFIHTAPLKDQKKYNHYHWHIDVIPKILLPAGFEISTGIDINVIDPDKLAALLRRGKKWE